MTTLNAHHNRAATHAALSWKQRLGLGVAAWAALGVVTALLDPGGSGLIGLMGGAAAWFGTGAGLAATYTVAHALYRRRGRRAAIVAGSLGVVAVCVLFAVVDWGAVASLAMTLGTIGAAIAILLHAPAEAITGADPSATSFDEPVDDDMDLMSPYTNLNAAWWHEEAQLRDAFFKDDTC